ncbi:MAG: hypothetical protein AAF719_00590 [Pseudomonadota bacterium]
MSRRFALFSVLMAVIAWHAMMDVPAYAAGSDKDEAELSEEEAIRSVELDGLVFPIFENRKLKNYLFASGRMRVADGKSTWVYREQAHKIRDAVIRASHRVSLHVEGDYDTLDVERAKQVFLEAANEAVGEDDALVDMKFEHVASKLGF